MTCRHKHQNISFGLDSTCSGYTPPQRRLKKLREEVKKLEEETGSSDSPKSTEFEIEEVEEVMGFVILQVRYPSCADCSYEGLKTMVYQNCSLKDVLKWKEIDPHFRGPTSGSKTKAPSPVARFPGDSGGLTCARIFVSAMQPRNRTVK